MALVTANQFRLQPDPASFATGMQQGQQLRGQFDKREAGQQKAQADKAAAQRETQLTNAITLGRAAQAVRDVPFEQRGAVIDRLSGIFEKLGIPAEDLDATDATDANLDSIIASAAAFSDPVSALDQAKTAQIQAETGQVGVPTQGKDFTLSPGQTRFSATGEPVASVDPKEVSVDAAVAAPSLPASIIGDATPEQAQVLQDVFNVSGGGKEGIKAVSEQKKVFKENAERANAPAILAERFPEATPEEAQQLQAAVDGAKTVAEGFKSAGKVREKQRQVKKGKVFQQRGIELIDKILSNPELDDVIGSIEGVDESVIPFGGQKIRSDAEATAIADINELRNILTAGNLNIMSGVLSETDIKIIADLAGGALTRTRGEDRFKEDVTNLRNKLAGNAGGTTGGQLPAGVTEDDIQETMRANSMTREQVLNDPRLGG